MKTFVSYMYKKYVALIFSQKLFNHIIFIKERYDNDNLKSIGKSFYSYVRIIFTMSYLLD